MESGRIASGVCHEMKWLLDQYIIDYFVDSLWEKIPSSWRELDRLNDSEWSLVLDERSSLSSLSTPLPLSILCLRSLLKEFSLLNRSTEKSIEELGIDPRKVADYRSLTICEKRKVKEKKRDEIERVVPMLRSIRDSRPFTSFVDIGSGLGHLTRAIASSIPHLGVRGVEGSDELVERAMELDEKRAEKRVERMRVWVDEGSKELIGDDEAVCVGGLHACGDLSPSILRLAVAQSTVSACLLFGCCYHKLNGGRDKLFIQDWSGVNENEKSAVDGFPMSETFKGERLSYAARELACHSKEDYTTQLREQTHPSHLHHAVRALAEVLMVDEGGERHAGVRGVRIEKMERGEEMMEWMEKALIDYPLLRERIKHKPQSMAASEKKGSVVKIHKVDVEFPYTPYQCQVDYMTKVIEALDTNCDAALESPTGTGKTLSLLCSTLAWIKEMKNHIKPSLAMVMDPTRNLHGASLVPRIFYCSRTHSQLSQVVRELNKTKYMDVKVCTLGSRDQLCVHEQVSKERDNKTKALKCRNLVAKRACHYYNQWNAMDMDSLNQLYGKNNKVLDIEELAKTAKNHKQCPFYRSRQLQESAELILLPYNYLIDPHLRQTHKIDLKGNIVIFDEAHNLEGVCEESVSCSISTADIAYTIKELQNGLQALHTRNEEIRSEMDQSTAAFGEGMTKEKKDKEINLNAVADLLEKIFELEKRMDELWENGKVTEKVECNDGDESKVFSGRSMIEMLEKAGFRKENAVDYSDLLHRVATYLAEEKLDEGQVAINPIKDLGHKLLDFGSFLSRVFADSFEAITRRGICDKDVAGDNFKVFAVRHNKKITFNYWCMTAGIAMRFLKSRGVTSIIVTSGTLAPLGQFTKNLGIPFKFTLQNMHAAKSSQVTVLRVSKGKDGDPLNGSYNNRTSHSYIQGVGEGIVKTVENTPHGVLVFFSSYYMMGMFVDKWKERGAAALSIWERVKRRKEIVVEPRNKAELSQVRFTFDNAIAKGTGSVFLAICKGKVSEGIDFADTHSRAVVIVGIPYPPLGEPKVILKRNYLTERNKDDKEMMSGQQWYTTEGFRSINQAIGRVLRHVDDYGAVVLLDSRFGSAPSSSFPRWVQNSFERVNDTNEIAHSLTQFFRRFGGNTKRPPTSSDASSTVEKRSRAITIGAVKSTTEPQGIRDIASEYTSRPVENKEEDKKTQMITKGFLNSALSSASSSSPSLPSSSSSIPKRPLLTVQPPLNPASFATSTTQSIQPPPAKKRVIVQANVRMEEMGKKEEEKKKSEFDGVNSQQVLAWLREADLLRGFREVAKEFKSDRDVNKLLKGLDKVFLPANHKLFKACIMFFDETTRNAMKTYLNDKGLYYK